MEMKTEGYGLEQKNELTCHVPTGQKINKILRVVARRVKLLRYSIFLSKSEISLDPEQSSPSLTALCLDLLELLELQEAVISVPRPILPQLVRDLILPLWSMRRLCVSKRIEGDGGAVNKLRLLASRQFVLFL